MASAFVFLLLLLLAATSAAVDYYSIIPIPSSFSPGTNSSVWLSPSGKFSFGFSGLSERTVVWTPNNFDPIPILPSNVFSLSINYYRVHLQLIAGATMLDKGNSVLYISDDEVIFQSFDHPTDTLLPGQLLPPDGGLFSRASEHAYLASGAGRINVSLNLEKDVRLRQRSALRYRTMSTSDSNMALVRVTTPAPAPPLETPDGSGYGKGITGPRKGLYDLHKYVIIGVSIGIAVLVISSFIIYYLTKQRGFCGNEEESKQNDNKLVLNHLSLAPKRYSYREIKKITKSFTEKIGQGGYGIVYKGQLPDAQLVAVKVFTKTHDNTEEFVNEVSSISRTSHVNIINLLGFCFEGKKRALVNEFMSNKSLDKFIYKSAECSFEWKKLYEIAVGVARGLEYLHRGCNTRIVHFDVKPQNILLDEDFCPKISDFGLAKLCLKKQSVIFMLGTRGTIGYIAPEVFSRNLGVISHKSDVYSYGIMLLQMAEARTNVEIKSFQSSEISFLEKIYEHVIVQNGKIYALLTEEEGEVVRRMLIVGFWCIQTAPSHRPSINNVVDMLAGNLQSIQIPSLPFLLSSPKPQFACSQDSRREFNPAPWVPISTRQRSCPSPSGGVV